MEPYITNIEVEVDENDDFRRVVYTAPHSQLVVMNLKPGEEIGMEVHKVDQFIRIESGKGVANLGGEECDVCDGNAMVIPEGTRHNITNTGDANMKLYSIYSPAQHKEGTVHHTKAEAEEAESE